MPEDAGAAPGDRPADQSRAALEVGLRRTLHVLRPYLEELVLIGGWVPYLHRQYGSVGHGDAGLSFTSELDILIAERPLPTT